MTLSSSDLKQIQVVIQERIGLRLSETQEQDLNRLLHDSQLFPTQIDQSILAAMLLEQPTDSPIWQSIIRCVTVGETYFFRNKPQFEALRTEVLPALIERRRQRNQLHLRLWSAGCATGEEPFSLAILLQDLLSDFEQWQITILATDINSGNLERAQKGLYRAWSFRNETPADIQERWFTREGESLKLATTIQRMVLFKQLNLLGESFPSFETGTMNMDLILCRNVTIYFDQKTTQGIAERFHRALNTDGWLVVGHAEPMSSVYHGFATRNFPNTVLYQKVAVAEPDPGVTKPLDPLPELAPKPKAVPVSRPAPKSTEAPKRAQVPKVESVPEKPQPTFWEKAKQAADSEEWNKALVWLVQAESENQFQPEVYHLRALVQWQLGDLDGAMDSLRQAIYCDANFALAHYLLADLSEALGDKKQALRHWRLAQRSIKDLPREANLPFAEDLTVDMLRSLLQHRLSVYEHSQKEISG
ncbi:MAG TPA: CheR family methyltransferase [Aggregatilineales bacterium]|nr:CheR family methyltransferase [Aggregatilineales bacterium]